MTKFFNKFIKPCFWPIFGPLSQFLGQKVFSGKSDSVTHMGFQQNAKILKELMIQFQENHTTNGRTEGKTDPDYCHGSKKDPIPEEKYAQSKKTPLQQYFMLTNS